jgi:3-deoxy-D-manno-octulosonic-acid transferase
MKGLYNAIFTFFLLCSAPYYLLRMWRRGNWKKDFKQRFGRYSSKVKQAITNRHLLWMHAVSVGEVNICTQLIRALEPRVPNLKIVVSTTTTTGMGELRRLLPSHIQKIYYPIDRRVYVERAIKTIHPEAIILVEAEIWPNFIWRASELGIPLFLVNARLSKKSFRRYKRFGALFRPIFGAFDGVGCQSDSDGARLRELGCHPSAIHVVGNLKFDAAKLEEVRVLDVPAILGQLGVSKESPVLVGGSTHPGEESILADVFLELKPRFPELFLILAPRHFERGKQVGNELESRGVPFAYRSAMSAKTQYPSQSLQALVLNTTGELKYFYEHASLIFIGKSLVAEGGQNPIEAGALGKPMVFGPNMQNFQAVAQSFVEKDAAIQVPDAAGLKSAVAEILANRERAQQMGRNAIAVVRENLGAIERSVDMILSKLDRLETYKAPARRH